MDTDKFAKRLAEAPRQRFADWPDTTLERGRPGVYVIWAGGDLLSVGVSWKDRHETTNPQAQGVWGRLQTHMIRNPDSALVNEIFERYVKPALTGDEVTRLDGDPAAAKAAAYRVLREDLLYQAIVTPDGATARAVSEAIRAGEWEYGPPAIGAIGVVRPQRKATERAHAEVPEHPLQQPANRGAHDETVEAIVDGLMAAPLRRFASWPDHELARGRPGVYAIWCDDDLVYAGCAYRDRAETTNPQAQGVWGRLQTHARGTQPSQLSDGIFRHYVLRELTSERLADADFDPRVASREFLQSRLAYRAVTTTTGALARAAEDLIRRGETALGRPRFNAK